MKIVFMNQESAERLVPNKYTAMISIISPHGRRHLKRWPFMLMLDFDDVEYPVTGARAFTKEDARKIKDFIRRLPPVVEKIVVHCEAGISRSAAVAKWLNEVYRTNEFPILYNLYNQLVYKTLKE